MVMGINNPVPQNLGAESKKAAKILTSFVKPNQIISYDEVIPPRVLQNAYGLVILTVLKAGFLFSGRAGSGVIVARLPDGQWSPPSAVMTAGAGVGGQIGAELTDFIFVLNTREAVQVFAKAGQLTLGGNVSLAAGPLGRNVEAAGAATAGNVAAIFSYAKTKGLFAGISLEGSALIERRDANRKFYGSSVSAKAILNGNIPPPRAVEPLFRILESRAFSNNYEGSDIYGDMPSVRDFDSVSDFGGRSDRYDRGGSDRYDRYDRGADRDRGDRYDRYDRGGSGPGDRYDRGGGSRSRRYADDDDDFGTRGGSRYGDRERGSRYGSRSDDRFRDDDDDYYGSSRRGADRYGSSSGRGGSRYADDKYGSDRHGDRYDSGGSRGYGRSPEDRYGDSGYERGPKPASSAAYGAPAGGAYGGPSGGSEAVALYSFAGEEAGDLPFRKGDIINVTKRTDTTDDWWTGELNGKSGIFPANYVEIV